MIKKQDKKDLKIKRLQAGSLIFLGASLIYLILGICIIAKYENFPSAQTSIMAASLKKNLQERREQNAISQIYLGTGLSSKKEIMDPKEKFLKSDSEIFVLGKMDPSLSGEKVHCSFFYLGSDDLPAPILAGRDSGLLENKQETGETVLCRFSSPGKQWQLEGNFKVIVSISSLGKEMEKTFSIK